MHACMYVCTIILFDLHYVCIYTRLYIIFNVLYVIKLCKALDIFMEIALYRHFIIIVIMIIIINYRVI